MADVDPTAAAPGAAAPDNPPDDAPPFGGSWPAVYAIEVGLLVVYVLAFLWLTRVYA